MRLPSTKPAHRCEGRGLVKRLLPRTLVGRSLLMILLPLLILQGVALEVFYGSHIDVVSRRLTGSVADELGFTIDLMNRFPGVDNTMWVLHLARSRFNLDISLDPGATLTTRKSVNVFGPMDDDLKAALTQSLHLPFFMDWTSDKHDVLVQVQVPDGVLQVRAPRKRLYLVTFYLFVLWVVGIAAVVFAIAALFMRTNQVQRDPSPGRGGRGFRHGPRRRHDKAGRRTGGPSRRHRLQSHAGTDSPLPGAAHGNAGRRVARLRTPLTRLRLTLAMLPARDELRHDIEEMTADVAEMERMSIGAYLAFARGEHCEQAEAVDLSALLEDVAARARRGGADGLHSTCRRSCGCRLRADAARRAITNLVDNAQRHARHVVLAAAPQGTRRVQVTVDDDGPGIPPEQRENVFRPFESGASDGTGLGLDHCARHSPRAWGVRSCWRRAPLGGACGHVSGCRCRASAGGTHRQADEFSRRHRFMRMVLMDDVRASIVNGLIIIFMPGAN